MRFVVPEFEPHTPYGCRDNAIVRFYPLNDIWPQFCMQVIGVWYSRCIYANDIIVLYNMWQKKHFGGIWLNTGNSPLMTMGTYWNILQWSGQRLSGVKSYNFIFWISVRGTGLKLGDNKLNDQRNMLEHFAWVSSKVIWGKIFITSFSGYLQGVWGSNSVTTNLMTRGTFCRGQVKGHLGSNLIILFSGYL